MRRAQSVRTYPRTSLNLGTIDPSDLSAIRETDELATIEDTLRKQLLEKDRENDKVRPVYLPPFPPARPFRHTPRFVLPLTHLRPHPAPIHHPLPPNPTRLPSPPPNNPIL